jgi:hypothetical protein
LPSWPSTPLVRISCLPFRPCLTNRMQAKRRHVSIVVYMNERPCLTNRMQAKRRHVSIVVYMNEEARPFLSRIVKYRESFVLSFIYRVTSVSFNSFLD